MDIDLTKLSTNDLLEYIVGASVGAPVLWLLTKRFLIKNLLSTADLTVVKTYIDLIGNLKDTNDHLVEQNDKLIAKVQLLEEEVSYLRQELIAMGMRKTSRNPATNTQNNGDS